jgi:hypothetical protein
MKNNNYRFNKFDFISIVIFWILLIISLIFYNFYSEKKSQLNLQNVECDFVTLINSEDEYNILKNNQNTKSIVPYYYFNAAINNGNTSNLYVIDSLENTNKTTFSDRLLIKSSNNDAENKIYIDETVSKKFKLKLNDKVNLSFADSNIEYIVTKIYKTDFRNIDGSMIVECSNETEEIIMNFYNSEKKFKGAFLTSNDHKELKNNLSFEYIDLNQLIENRTIMFQSDIMMFNGIFVFMCVLTLLYTFLVPYIKNCVYIKKNLLIDFNNKFTLDSEIKMFNKYNISFGIFIICILFLMLLTPLIQEKFFIYSFRSIVYSFVYYIYILMCICGIILNIVVTKYKIKKLYN